MAIVQTSTALNAAQFSTTFDDVFGRIASRYDLLCDLFSSRLSQSVELRRLDAHSMAGIADNSVDLFSISLGLKICDRLVVLREAMRVLRPGGRLVVLEASNIRLRWLQGAYLRYMSVCMPVIGWIATGGDASAYRYLLQGISAFPTAECLADEICDLGFDEVSFERLSLGIVAVHVARKPKSQQAS
jgi:demethylmenaquinone methyltransferase/2-methoxy-6-polyprenyl-1,4-benzoquinol methylase